MKTPHTQAIDAAIADAVAERQQTAENRLTSERACEYCEEHVATGYVRSYKACVCACCFENEHGPTMEEHDECREVRR